MSTASFSLQMRLKSAIFQICLAFRRTICAVRINIPAGAAFIEKLFAHIAAENGGIRNIISPKDFVFDIHFHMVLAAGVVLSVLLPPGEHPYLPLMLQAGRTVELSDVKTAEADTG